MKVYEILLQYSTDEGTSVESYILTDYKKAVAKFKELIEDEKTNIYWIKNAFKNDKSLNEYEFDTNIEIAYLNNREHELYWEIMDTCDCSHHDYLELRIKEVL